MKNYIKNFKTHIFFGLSALILGGTISSCTKEDDYKKFAEGGEISYTGKLDSAKVWSGKNRVMLSGLFMADPKITQAKIFWNNRADSVTIPVQKKNVIDTLSFFIENVTEGVHNFIIYTYDAAGNRSIPVYRTGRSYGTRYEVSLFNRPVGSAITNQAGVTRIEWQGMDRLTGVFATEVQYTDVNNKLVTVKAPIDSTGTTLKDFKASTNIKYRTLFLPDTVSIDTFKTNYVERYVPRFVEENITNTYLKNTGAPFNRDVWDGSRWGVLADWTSNAGAKNISSNRYGGYELRGGVGVLSFEGGWGLPRVTNGLIYQTITLPAGTYSFRLNGLDQNSGGSRYIAVARGTTLPNVADITSNSIAFANVADRVLDFTLAAETTVSIGFAVSIDDSGQYIKVGNVRLYKQSYL
ncbi:MAG: DUF5013 domain-containing protein [Flavobacteriales bacterium]|nr:MAG: DUF5013 domain-containing protein [Flavobacteriales bacterium]